MSPICNKERIRVFVRTGYKIKSPSVSGPERSKICNLVVRRWRSAFAGAVQPEVVVSESTSYIGCYFDHIRNILDLTSNWEGCIILCEDDVVPVWYMDVALSFWYELWSSWGTQTVYGLYRESIKDNRLWARAYLCSRSVLERLHSRLLQVDCGADSGSALSYMLSSEVENQSIRLVQYPVSVTQHLPRIGVSIANAQGKVDYPWSQYDFAYDYNPRYLPNMKEFFDNINGGNASKFSIDDVIDVVSYALYGTTCRCKLDGEVVTREASDWLMKTKQFFRCAVDGDGSSSNVGVVTVQGKVPLLDMLEGLWKLYDSGKVYRRVVVDVDKSEWSSYALAELLSYGGLPVLWKEAGRVAYILDIDRYML